MKPGPESINPDQIKRRWRVHLNEKLKITKDFYSLKHLHTDQTAAELGLAAAAHDGHTRKAMVRKIYAVNEDRREHEKIKALSIKFGV